MKRKLSGVESKHFLRKLGKLPAYKQRQISAHIQHHSDNSITLMDIDTVVSIASMLFDRDTLDRTTDSFSGGGGEFSGAGSSADYESSSSSNETSSSSESSYDSSSSDCSSSDCGSGGGD